MGTHRFHETVQQATVEPPSDRSTGLVFTAVALIVAILWRDDFIVSTVASVVALILGAISILLPRLLHRPAVMWFRLGLLLHKIVNPVIMLVMFAIAIIPTGLIMRLWYDPLNLRKTTRQGSYWIERTEADPRENSMRNQF